MSLKRRVAGVFDRAAASYDRAGHFAGLGSRLVERIAPRPGLAALDVASGRGAVLFPLARAVGRRGAVTGIDFSPGMVARARRDLGARGYAWARVLRMDAEALRFPDASFDLATCAFAIYCFPHPEIALAELLRVLRPGGRAFVATWGKQRDASWDWYDEVLRRHRLQHRLRQVAGRQGDPAAWMREAGFSRVVEHEEPVTFRFADAREWWQVQWSTAHRYLFEALSAPRLRRVRQDIDEHLEAARARGALETKSSLRIIEGTRPVRPRVRPRPADEAQRLYRRVAERAIGWIDARSAQFALPARSDPSASGLARPIGELALAGHLLRTRSAPGSPFERVGARWMNACWSYLDQGERLRDMVAARPDLIIRASTYLPFFRHGLRAQAFERALARMVRVRGVAAQELAGWVALGVATSLEEIGVRSPWPVARAFRGTWLWHRPEPESICEASGYSVTHTVFYMTRFGERPRGLPGPQRAYFLRWGPTWAEHYRRLEQWDLMGELLMALRCAGASLPDDWAHVLHGSQRASGLVPGPAGGGHSLEPGARTRARIELLEHYHSTLVALMACLLLAEPATFDGPPAPRTPTVASRRRARR